MPALQRAIAVPAMDDVAMGIGEDLDLDVPGPVDELLEVDAGVFESGLGFVAGRLKRALRGWTRRGRRACPCRRRRRRP